MISSILLYRQCEVPRTLHHHILDRMMTSYQSGRTCRMARRPKPLDDCVLDSAMWDRNPTVQLQGKFVQQLAAHILAAILHRLLRSLLRPSWSRTGQGSFAFACTKAGCQNLGSSIR